MTIIDISRPLKTSLAGWPGDVRFELAATLRRSAGASVNVSRLSASTHLGTHVDAPWHYADDGPTIEQLDLRPFWGLAQVITVSKHDGPLTLADLAQYDLTRAPRLLVHSAASHADSTQFPKLFVYPSPELVSFLSQAGIMLYGSDAPSMDRHDDPMLPGHHALRQHNIAILEGLDLSQAPDGLYDLVALPLPIVGGDGSLVRAAIQPL
jgi:arylformamidase